MPMKIKIQPCDWGKANGKDIQKLLEDVASHILRELRDPFDEIIHVINRPELDTPLAIHRTSNTAPYEVNLTAKDTHWCQYAYQFAHEFCHVLSGHDRLKNNPNNWFHESICELASFFVLRRMAQSWRTHPPYSNWTTYSDSLKSYAQSMIAQHRSLAPTGSFSTWLSRKEDKLRQCKYLRDLNGVVAIKLLPLFEKTLTGWSAVPHLPVCTGRIKEYIEAWKVDVHQNDRPFVECVGKTLLEG